VGHILRRRINLKSKRTKGMVEGKAPLVLVAFDRSIFLLELACETREVLRTMSFSVKCSF